MKFEPLIDDATGAALRVDWLLSELEPVSDFGRAVFEAIEPFCPGEEPAAAARSALIADLASTLDAERIDEIRDVLRTVPDAGSAFARAGMGDTLADVNFLEVQRFCDAVSRLEVLLRAYPQLVPVRCTDVAKALERGRAGRFGFYVDDSFDAALASERRELQTAQAEFDSARGRLGARIAAQLGREDPGTDEFIIMREDLREAVPQGVRVIREAPTYFLCELEFGEPALAALRHRDDVAGRVAEMEEAVRARLSRVIGDHAALLAEAARELGELDVLVGAVRFCARHACRAAVYTTEPVVEFEDAHFPALQSELERQGRAYTPIGIALEGPSILTGPNMGGKTAALQTAGFTALCAAFGLPVAAKRARVCLFPQIAWLGAGAGNEAGGLLSSFALEVVRLRDVLAHDRKPALLLIDEFARTTTPDEARALLIALIDHLARERDCALVATHLSGIARAAGVSHFAVRGLRGTPRREPGETMQEALSALAESMDYRVERITGERAQTGDAIFLAGLLGMDAAFIEKAKDAFARGEVRPDPKRSKNP